MATINREMDITENELIQEVIKAFEKQEEGITTLELIEAMEWEATDYYKKKMRGLLNSLGERLIVCKVKRFYPVGGWTTVRGFRLG